MIVGTCVLPQNKSGLGLALARLGMDLQEDVPCPSREGMWCLALELSQGKILLGYRGMADVNREGNECEEICSPCAVTTLQAPIIRGKFSVQTEQLSPKGI